MSKPHTLDEQGSVESGLVLIPTTLLFLVLVQLVLTGSWQLSEGVRLHDLVMRSEVNQTSLSEFAGGGREILISRESYSHGSNFGGAGNTENGVAGEMTRVELRSTLPVFSPFTSWLGDVVKTRNVAFAFE